MALSTEIRERKFLLSPGLAADVLAWARARLDPDPYGGGPHGDTYHTTSLYFDTRDFDVFHRRGSFGRSKYRIRRYGAAPQLFLERKLKNQDSVIKRRSVIEAEELGRLSEAEPRHGWAGYWFHRRILARQLRPVCQVSYARAALVAGIGVESVRLTLDQDLHAGTSLIAGADAILELKYRGAAPPVFEELISVFGLIAEPVSKYRFAVAALELATEKVSA